MEALLYRTFRDAEVARAYDARGGDGGRDFEVVNGGRRRIFQLKHFGDGRGIRAGRRKAIETSFESAMVHQPAEWTLVVPSNLTPGEWSFVEHLADGRAVHVSVMGRAELDAMLAGFPDLAALYDLQPRDGRPEATAVRAPLGLMTEAAEETVLEASSPTGRGYDGVSVDSERRAVGSYDPITSVAAGNRRQYALEAGKVEGGQGNVHRALHKPSGLLVAFKKLNSELPTARARMKREIEIGRMLAGHPNAMPVLDHAADHTWFVMPWAEATAVDRRAELRGDEALRTLLREVGAALEAAHSHGWIHRDIKPANILCLEGRWTVADWGLGRRPRGQTTNADRTRVGYPYGTRGFAPPELSIDAHQVGPPADVFSLGQLIGWVLTGQDPSPNIPLVPAAGPWRGVVKTATQLNPDLRQQTVAELLVDIAHETEAPAEPAIARAESLRSAVEAGDAAAAASLVSLAARNTDDPELCIDLLARLDVGLLAPALLADPQAGTEIARAMALLLGSTDRHTERGDVDTVILWLFDLARQAAAAGELDLLEASCDGAFEWDGLWDQWRPQDQIRPWLQTITGDTASTVARSLRRYPACAEHFSALAADRRVDYRIRAAVAQPG